MREFDQRQSAAEGAGCCKKVNDPENPNQAAVMDDLRLYDEALLEVKSGA